MYGLFITGTDTGVGKTHVTCEIARSLAARGRRVGLYKPVCSGAEVDPEGRMVWDDLQRLNAALPEPVALDHLCPQRFAAPLAPPLAAQAEGRSIDPGLLRTGIAAWEGAVDVLLVEGAGGLLCPLTESETVADLAADLGFPLLIVSAQRLGTINHTLLTVEVARHRGMPIAGIVMNRLTTDLGPSAQSNAQEIGRLSGVAVLGEFPFRPAVGLPDDGAHVKIDWWKVIRESDTRSAAPVSPPPAIRLHRRD